MPQVVVRQGACGKRDAGSIPAASTFRRGKDIVRNDLRIIGARDWILRLKAPHGRSFPVIPACHGLGATKPAKRLSEAWVTRSLPVPSRYLDLAARREFK